MSEHEYLRLMLAWRTATAVCAVVLVVITIKRLKSL